MTDVALSGGAVPPVTTAESSFATFYEEFAPRVRALAARRLRNRDLADDVVQETLLRCYRARHRFDDARPAWPWVKTIATNVCIDLQREGAGWRELPAGIDVLEPPPRGWYDTDPDQAYVANERRECISVAMHALSPRQRRVVLLRDVEGWRADDVASMEGSSTDAVKAALKRGRQVFRLAYTAAATPRGLLGALIVAAAATADAFQRALRAKVKAATSASGIKAQLASMSSLVVATGVATVAVVGVTAAGAGAARSAPVGLDHPATVAAVSAPAAAAAGAAAPVVEVVKVAAAPVAPQQPVTPAPEIRQTLAAPVPGDESLTLAEIYVTSGCRASDTRRSACETVSAAVGISATVETPAPLP